MKEVLTSDTVGIEVLDKGRYGRTIARVYLDSVSINHYTVASGNCWVYARYAKDHALSIAPNQIERLKGVPPR